MLLVQAKSTIRVFFYFSKLYVEIYPIYTPSKKKSAILCKADPWAGATCGREKCFPCNSSGEGKAGKCAKENILYKLTCLECKENETTAEYIGESSRSLFLRTNEHLAGARRKESKNPIYNHGQMMHSSLQEAPRFTVELLRTFQTPLARMIAESVTIDQSEADIIINSKSEWGSSRIPRLVIEVGQKVNQEDFKGRKQETRRILPCTSILQGESSNKATNINKQAFKTPETPATFQSATPHREGSPSSTIRRAEVAHNTSQHFTTNKVHIKRIRTVSHSSASIFNTNLPAAKKPCHSHKREYSNLSRVSTYPYDLNTPSRRHHSPTKPNTLARWLTKPKP